MRLDGEYWITPHDVIYCDGDASVDVPDHNMIVLDHARSLIAQICSDTPSLMFMYGIWSDDQCDGLMDRHMIVDQLLTESDEWFENGTIDQDAYDDVYEFMVKNGVDRELIEIFGGNKDYKLHAIREWGWIRLDSSSNLELWSLDQKTCDLLFSGLLQIEQDFCESIDHRFNIEVRSTGKILFGIEHSFMGSKKDILDCHNSVDI